MRKPISGKGFTLIELLVVVGIIAVLAAVIMAALNSARSKGGDAGVKSNLKNAISQGEIFYNTNTSAPNTYTSVCTATVAANGANGLTGFMVQAARAGGVSTTIIGNGTAGAYNRITCHDSATGWAAEGPLSGSVSGSPKMWCVDSVGKAQQNTTNLGAAAVSC